MRHRAKHATRNPWSAPGGRHRDPETGRRTGNRSALAVTAVFLSAALAGLITMPHVVNADEGTDAAATDTRKAAKGKTDLRKGAVFLMSNAEDGNEVVAFSRASDGKLTEVERFPTGGTGSGSFEDSANALVVGSAEGEASPNMLIDQRRLLFVPNAGSSTISVFQINADSLELVEEVPSGGQKPVSLTVNNGLLYVLNSGETANHLFDEDTNVLENCTSGARPEITGFSVSSGGELTPVKNSTRQLSGQAHSGCAQVSFSADGRSLLVTERLAKLPAHADSEVDDDEGTVVTFQVRQDGTPGRKRVQDATGRGPFGFAVTRSGTVLTTEQFGGFANDNASAVASYTFDENGGLEASSESVFNKQTDTCWVVVNGDESLAYASSPFGDGTISSFSVTDGVPKLLHESASAEDGKDRKNDHVPTGATDLALSSDSRYLYQLNSFEGTLTVFKANQDGSLAYVEDHRVFDLEVFGEGGEGDPMGIAVI
ncbi:lactonase family protein [Micromonospora profundi]|uniref:lactonase family protein n=1 Tax=Micromonospora profundi TaxID=1420889 RepID=UPI0036A9D700